MTELVSVSPNGNMIRPAEHLESEVLNRQFEQLDLPAGFSRRRLDLSDAELYLAFDDYAFANTDIPRDHECDSFTAEDFAAGIERGDIIDAVFDDEGNVVATMWLTPQPEADSLEINNINVDPKYRNQKIGSYFLLAAEDLAEKKGFSSCNLHVDPLNTIAMHLYANRGYKVTGYEHSDDFGMSDWLIMTKQFHEETSAEYTEFLEIPAGYEEALAAAVADGYHGVAFNKNPGNPDPKLQSITFAR